MGVEKLTVIVNDCPRLTISLSVLISSVWWLLLFIVILKSHFLMLRPWPMSSCLYREKSSAPACSGGQWFLPSAFFKNHPLAKLFAQFLYTGWDVMLPPHLSFSLSCWPAVQKLRTLISQTTLMRPTERGDFSYLQMRLNFTVWCKAFKDSQWQYLQSCSLGNPE